jgi:hypothetical protein
MTDMTTPLPRLTNKQTIKQMDAGLDPFPLLLRRHHGPPGLSPTPRLSAETAFHGGILRLVGADVVLFHWGKSTVSR